MQLPLGPLNPTLGPSAGPAFSHPITQVEADHYPLGKHLNTASSFLTQQGWLATVRAFRTPQDMPKSVEHLPHPAAHLLNHMRKNGVPIKMTTSPWSLEQRQQAMSRGPHKSSYEYQDFLESEMADMVEKGQWMVLPFHEVQHLPNLRISPIGVVPQRDRRPRTIVDYTFSNVNQDTVPLAPAESMQFGHALDRVLQHIVHADPRHGPVHMIKVDVADGFYRLWTSPQDIPNLGVAFPPAPDGTPLVAFPLTLPMGWKSSPPFFCALTETIVDLANRSTLPFPVDHPHHLEVQANGPSQEATAQVTPAQEVAHSEPTTAQEVSPATEETTAQEPQPRSATALPSTSDCCLAPTHPLGPRRPRLEKFDVYVDDFIAVAQGTTPKLHQARRKLFHCIDQVLRPCNADDPSHRQEPISIKKLAKGDAKWDTTKEILGWIVDSVSGTIQLPPRRLQRLQELLDDLPATKKRISTTKWQTILGELRSMSLAIPGLRGLFSLFQEALTKEERRRVPLSPSLHGFLDDLRTLTASLAVRPTRLREIVPSDPLVTGTTDACGVGMGGIAFLPCATGPSQPILWRAPFPEKIQQQLVTADNRSGCVSISDLELAATVAQHDILAVNLDLREHTVYTLSDNTPAAAWQTKGSTTTTGPAAYLLRLQALHQRHFRYNTRVSHIPGTANVMADDCSRLWALTDSELLSHFNSSYPQERPWQLLPLQPATLSTLISALLRTRHATLSWPRASGPLTEHGKFGPTFAFPLQWTPPLKESSTQPNCSKSLPSASAEEPSLRAVSQSDLTRWLRPYAKSARLSHSWVPQTHG